MTRPDRSAELVGIWTLTDITNRDMDGNVLPSSYGPKKMGVYMFNDDHRAMVMISDGRDVLPYDGPREYTSYTGRYTFDGETVTIEVDRASNTTGTRSGSHQTRPARLEGENRIVLTAPVVEIGGIDTVRELTWERVG
jgi:hypothetical protein